MVSSLAETQAALELLGAIPGVAPFAAGAAVVASLIGGDDPVPHVIIDDPFQEGNILWGVPRNGVNGAKSPHAAPANELSFHVDYTVQPVPGKSIGNPWPATSADAGLSALGIHELDIPQGLAAASVPWGSGGGLKVTDQVPPYSIDEPHSSGFSSFSTEPGSGLLTIPDVLWAEAQRRGSPLHLVGTDLFIDRGIDTFEFPRRVTVNAVRLGSGEEWDFFTGDGSPLSDALEAWLAAAKLRRDAVVDPVFDDIDLRSWEGGGYVDAYLDAVAKGKVQHFAIASKWETDWRTGKPGHPAIARDEWDAKHELELQRYEQRRAEWIEWRASINAYQEQQEVFEEAAAEWQDSWYEAVELGASFDEASAIASDAIEDLFSPDDLTTPLASTGGGGSPGEPVGEAAQSSGGALPTPSAASSTLILAGVGVAALALVMAGRKAA